MANANATSVFNSKHIAYDPDLIPPLDMMRSEGIDVLEEWFRWAEEWSMLLRVYGRITRTSSVLEIGCGLGRIAFPLRYVLSPEGSYNGFEICEEKVAFLNRTFHPAYPHFQFTWANIRNAFYNPHGAITASNYEFPYPDSTFDIVYAASVFTHLMPDTTAHYMHETARVLKSGGRAIFSFFLLDHYLPGRVRPLGFAREAFNFDHSYDSYGDNFAIVVPEVPEQMTAYRFDLANQLLTDAGLRLAEPPVPGLWSGATEHWVGMQDILALRKPD
jgi:SAM-dependent methyltransferase